MNSTRTENRAWSLSAVVCPRFSPGFQNMIDIGEAANNIMQLAPEIEQRNLAMWRHLRGAYDMRIKLTHGYRSVNDRIVWNTATDYLPELAMCIAAEQSRVNEEMP